MVLYPLLKSITLYDVLSTIEANCVLYGVLSTVEANCVSYCVLSLLKSIAFYIVFY